MEEYKSYKIFFNRKVFFLSGIYLLIFITADITELAFKMGIYRKFVWKYTKLR